MRDVLFPWQSRSCHAAWLPVATQFVGAAGQLHSDASQMAPPSNYSKYDSALSYFDVFVSHVQEFFVLYQFCLKKSHQRTLRWMCELSDRAVVSLHFRTCGPGVIIRRMLKAGKSNGEQFLRLEGFSDIAFGPCKATFEAIQHAISC